MLFVISSRNSTNTTHTVFLLVFLGLLNLTMYVVYRKGVLLENLSLHKVYTRCLVTYNEWNNTLYKTIHWMIAYCYNSNARTPYIYFNSRDNFKFILVNFFSLVKIVYVPYWCGKVIPVLSNYVRIKCNPLRISRKLVSMMFIGRSPLIRSYTCGKLIHTRFCLVYLFLTN